MLGWGGLGALYRAHDGEGNHPVALRILTPELSANEEVVGRLQEVIQKAAPIEHKNLVGFVGMGREADLVFLVHEHVDGQPLRELLLKKKKASKSFSLKGAFNVVAHVTNALSQVHDEMVHGALHPGNVLVNRAGRIKVAELGLTEALAPLGDVAPFLATQEPRYLAPEVVADPESGSPQSDVYSLGVMLTELLTGIPPSESLKPPGQVREGLPAQIDVLVKKCLSVNPDDRYLAAGDMKEALLDIIQQDSKQRASSPGLRAPSSGQHPAASSGERQAVGAAGSEQRAGSSGSSPTPETPGAAEPPKAVFGKGAAVMTQPGIGGPPPPPGSAAGGQAGFGPSEGVASTQPGLGGPGSSSDPFPPTSSGEFDLASMVDEASSEDEEKYLVQKGKLDLGPFSFRDLKVQIRIGEVKGKDIIVDTESGARVKVKEHDKLGPYFKGVQRHKELQRRAATESATKQTEKRKKHIFIGASLGAAAVVALVVGGILLYQGQAEEDDAPTRRKEADLRYETSWEGDQGSKKGKRRRRRRRRSRGGWSGGKWDNSQDIDFGSGDGPSEKLSRGQIHSVMSRYNQKIGRCLIKHSLSKVTIRLQIAGSGKLNAVRTSGASGRAAACIRRAVRSARFPKFNGSRTTGSYTLRVQ
jgi:serine/threonine protein kinase